MMVMISGRDEGMQDIVRLVDRIEKLTRLAETRSAEGRLLGSVRKPKKYDFL